MPMFAAGANVNITGGAPIFNESTGDININQSFGGNHPTTYNYDSFNVRDNTYDTRNTTKTTVYGNEDESGEAPPKRPNPQRNPRTEPNLNLHSHPPMYGQRPTSLPGPNFDHPANHPMANFQMPPPPQGDYSGYYSQGVPPMGPPQMGHYPYGGYPPPPGNYPPPGGYNGYGQPPYSGPYYPPPQGQGPQRQRAHPGPPEQNSYDRHDEEADTQASSGEERAEEKRKNKKKSKGSSTDQGRGQRTNSERQGFEEGNRSLSSKMGDLTLESKDASGGRKRAKEPAPPNDRGGPYAMNGGFKSLPLSHKHAFIDDEVDDEGS